MLHQIGAGALGPVFRAYEPEQDRLVAVKLFRIDIPPERSHQLVVQLERLIAADLTHAGIAAPLATGLSDVSAYLAMDFVAADSLDIVIRDQQTPPSDVVRVASQLASALDLAAAIDITHGALHPRDVLLSADDVRMTGIGIARAIEEVGAAAPIRRPYTAPERASGGRWDRRADVFSLAALVFELLTRRRISGPGDQSVEALASIAGVNADALDRVFDRALAEHPGDRFATAGDFARALQGALEKKRSVAGRAGPSVRPPVAAPVVAEPVSTTPLPVEELPLFTDSMLGETPEPAASDAAPPPIADVAHEALAPNLSFRDAPLSMVESLHEPDMRPHRGHDIDDVHGGSYDAGHRLMMEDFTEAVRDSPAASRDHSMSLDHEGTKRSHDVPFKHHEPEFDIEEAVELEAASTAGPAPFESVSTDTRSSSGVWPLMLALVVGIALGFGMAMLLLGRDRVPQAPRQASVSPAAGRSSTEVRDEPVREVTEQTVASSPKPAAEPSSPSATEPPRDRANAAVAPAPSPSAVAKTPPARPTVTAPARTPDRPDSRPVARTPEPRTQGKPPVAAAKVTPTKPALTPKTTVTAASKTAPAAASRPATKPAAAPPVTAAAPTPPKPEAGTLVVESRPAGASVYVDGRRVGTTPLVLDTLKVGEYTIGLELDGYKRWATTTRVTTGERARVAASLER